MNEDDTRPAVGIFSWIGDCEECFGRGWIWRPRAGIRRCPSCRGNGIHVVHVQPPLDRDDLSDDF